MLLYLTVFILSVFISANSQVLLKLSANMDYTKRIFEYLNPHVIVAYTLFIVSMVLTTIAYRKIPLSLGPVIESMGIVFIAFLSYVFLKEKVSKRKLFGYLMITIGILITLGS